MLYVYVTTGDQNSEQLYLDCENMSIDCCRTSFSPERMAVSALRPAVSKIVVSLHAT